MSKRLPACLVALLLPALAACVRDGVAPRRYTPGAGGAAPLAPVELAQSRELAGRPVRDAADGPWKVRRLDAAAGASDATGGGAGGVAPLAALRAASRVESRWAFGAPGVASPDAGLPAAPAEGAVRESLGEAESAPAAGDRVAGPAGGRTEGLRKLSEDAADGSALGTGAASAPAGATPLRRFAGRATSSVEAAPGHDAATAQRVPGPALRAGSTDDNADYPKFLEFLAAWSDRKDVARQVQDLDVRDRRFLRVMNAQGKPVPGARVQVVDESADKVIWKGTTYGDGRVPFYPHIAFAVPAGAGETSTPAARKLLVEAQSGEARSRMAWDGTGEELVVKVDAAKPVADPVALDVLFLIDTTGSMGDEIDRIKETLLEVTRRLRSLGKEFDLRYGAVLYRDLGDDYVTRAHPFTADIGAFDSALQSVQAAGGGDEPESLNQGLAEAVGRMDWREGAAKVAFLIADAPPHMDYSGDVPYGESLKAAVGRGIRIHAVAASGLNPTGTFIFRQIAQLTRGKFIFIEYGAPGQDAKGHGVAGATASNNLDEIVFENIRDEVARWGRE